MTKKSLFPRLKTMAEWQQQRRASPKKPAISQKKPRVSIRAKKPAPKRRIRQRPRTTKARKDTAWVRRHVFERERQLCRYCGDLPGKQRKAESRHELLFKSLGGKVTPENCVASCGDGVNGCHGLAQRNELTYQAEDSEKGAEGVLFFTVQSAAAAEWLGLPIGTTYPSRPRLAVFTP